MHNGFNGKHPSEDDANRWNLTKLTVEEFLTALGAGRPVPGVGSAAAAKGAMAGQLIKTVTLLTLGKEKYVNFHARAEAIRVQSEPITADLIRFIDEDATVFHQVIEARIARNMAIRPQERERLKQQWLQVQQKATLVPLSIASACVTLSEFALELYDEGFRSARGDSGDAAEAARAGACGALFTVNLNLKPYGNEPWAMNSRKKAAQLLVRIKRVSEALDIRLTESLAPEVCP